MALNVGINSKEAFRELKRLTPQKRIDVASQPGYASLFSSLTPAEFAELFPKYYQKGLPDIGGFREAISRKSRQKQDDINYGLSQGATSIEEAERMGGWRRRFGGDEGETRYAGGSLANNQKEAYKAAIAEGLSPSAAKILVANMSGESLKNPRDHHWDRSHMSQGIVQWDPERAERIKNKFGAYPKDMSVAEQTKAAIWEMKTYYKKSYDALTNDNLSNEERLHVIVSDYERPQYVDKSVSERLGYLKGLNVEETSQNKLTEGGNYEITKSGFVVPKDRSLYDSKNTEQCATLGKAFNPNIGRSNSWTVVKGDIKPGMVVATMRYNNPGPDRTGSGYHTGVAMTAPDREGNFLLLEQFSGRPAQIRSVNANSYDGGKLGGVTSFGIIQSNGKIHTEQSTEALRFGASIATNNEMRSQILSNIDGRETTGTATAGNAGSQEAVSVSVKPNQTAPVPGAPLAPGQVQQINVDQPQDNEKKQTPENKVQNQEKLKKEESASVVRKFKLNEEEFVAAIKRMDPRAAMPFVSNSMIIDGFNEDERVKRAGVSIGNNGIITFKNYNDPEVKKVLQDFDSKKIMTPIRDNSSNDKVQTGEGMGGPSVTVNNVNKNIEPNKPLEPVESLLSFISQGEGGYNAMNQGTRGKKIIGSSNDSSKVIGKKLEEMTVGEIMKMQEGSLKTGRKIFAAGRYQIIPSTMKSIVEKTGIDKNAIFNKETQDKLGMALIQSRPKLYDFLTGKSNDVRSAQIDMASEWYSIPHPDTGKAIGGGPNKAQHNVESVKKALLSAKNEIASRPIKTENINVAKSETPTATVSSPKSFLQKAKEMIVGQPASYAETSSSPENRTSVVFDRMRKMNDKTTNIKTETKPLPALPSIETTTDKNVEKLLKENTNNEKQSMNIPVDNNTVSSVIVNNYLKDKTSYMSPSLERAMARNRGIESDISVNRIGGRTSIA